MEINEIIEMERNLNKMQLDDYMQCKFIFFAVSKDSPDLNNFINILFSLTDKCRPLLIEMK